QPSAAIVRRTSPQSLARRSRRRRRRRSSSLSLSLGFVLHLIFEETVYCVAGSTVSSKKTPPFCVLLKLILL
ncbi:hypothetical protein TorRG33x02_237510, partial [Trema orientale]